MSDESLQITIISMRCSFYILFTSVTTVIVIALSGLYYIWNVFFPHQEANLSTGTGLTEQRYSSVWSQLNTSIEP